jgi:hypothetical protein
VSERITCGNCTRKSGFDGCSRVECPMRKTITAQPTGERYLANSVVSQGGFAVPASWGWRTVPTTKDE